MTNLRKTLRKITFFHDLHLWYWGWREFLFINGWQILQSRRNYSRHVKSLRLIFGRRKLRVVFLVAEPSKWKSQSIYDRMKGSSFFEPIIAVTVMDNFESKFSMEENERILNERVKYFRGLGCECVIAFTKERGVIAPSEFSPDIVWYTQPWLIPQGQDPYSVSKYALTCYTPYFVQNYGGLDMDCLQPFHRFLWRHFTLNKFWAGAFMKSQGCRRAGKVVGCGHPMIDLLNQSLDENASKDYIIYAPHFSINQCESFATIHKNGKDILRFAKQHPEYQWVFKPHPNLRYTLPNVDGWSQEKTEMYYREWEKIGMVCYDGSYPNLFNHARLMITDCASFLVEFACTKQPIMHLISSEARYKPHPIACKLFNTYYQVHNWDEFVGVFDLVCMQNKDPKRDERLEAIREMNLHGTSVAEETVSYLECVFNRH